MIQEIYSITLKVLTSNTAYLRETERYFTASNQFQKVACFNPISWPNFWKVHRGVEVIYAQWRQKVIRMDALLLVCPECDTNYCPPTKLPEGNVSTRVCLFTGKEGGRFLFDDYSGVSKGGVRDAWPPWGPNSFNFMQFLANFGKIACWWPPKELASPPQGNPGSATGLPMMHWTSLYRAPRQLSWRNIACKSKTSRILIWSWVQKSVVLTQKKLNQLIL